MVRDEYTTRKVSTRGGMLTSDRKCSLCLKVDLAIESESAQMQNLDESATPTTRNYTSLVVLYRVSVINRALYNFRLEAQCLTKRIMTSVTIPSKVAKLIQIIDRCVLPKDLVRSKDS